METLNENAGSAAIGVFPTFWLFAFSMFIFLSLAYVKRYSEIVVKQLGEDGNLSGRGYAVADGQIVMILGAVTGCLSVLIFALYMNDAAVADLYRTPQILWLLCPLLLYWVNRIWIKAARGLVDGDPLVFAMRDRVSLVAVLAGVAIILLARYWEFAAV